MLSLKNNPTQLTTLINKLKSKTVVSINTIVSLWMHLYILFWPLKYINFKSWKHINCFLWIIDYSPLEYNCGNNFWLLMKIFHLMLMWRQSGNGQQCWLGLISSGSDQISCSCKQTNYIMLYEHWLTQKFLINVIWLGNIYLNTLSLFESSNWISNMKISKKHIHFS